MQCEMAFMQGYSFLEYLLTQLHGPIHQAMEENVPFCCVVEPEASSQGDDKSNATTESGK